MRDDESEITIPRNTVSRRSVLQTSALATGAVPIVGTLSVSTAAEETDQLPPGRIPMEEVPQDIRRRAARLLEDAQGTPVTWESAELGEFAHPIGRPDVDGIAYYELAVEPVGFVVCATGKHDAPIPHWNTDAPTIGASLEELGGNELGRLVWIDRLRYVAEDPDGRKMAARGNDVPRIEGLEALFEADEAGPRRVRYGPQEEVPDTADQEVEEDYEPQLLVEENNRNPPEEFSFGRWESYGQLVDNYVAAYGPLLEDLRRRASRAWDELEARPRSLGIGATYREPLIDGQTVEAVEAVDGDAAGKLFVERQARNGAHDVLELTPMDGAAPGEVVEVTLTDGEDRERLTYRVEDESDYRPQSGRMDWVGTDGATDADAITADTDWAGGFRLHPYYRQFPYQGCAVGCGPVAWALLFGWGDKQADGGKFNSTWWPRFGLYLENGGRWRDGARDKVAPDKNWQDNGGPKNVMKELNGHLNVFCLGDSGATAPWDMDKAVRYLRGRTYTRLEIHHSWSGRPIKRARIETRESIRGNANNKGPTPVVVGKGWMSHYPMAYAYWDSTWHPDHVKVNNGWGENPNGAQANEWIWAQTWFSGEIYP